MKAVDLIYAMNHVGSDFVEEAEIAKLEHAKAKKQHTGISRRPYSDVSRSKAIVQQIL